MKDDIFIKGKLDKRLAHRLILKGELSEAELQAYLAGLPDLSENVQEIEVSLEACLQGNLDEN
ncbi:MAG TPA: hypothetical protein PLT64_01015 [Syntrophales bacterium]|nr:hypothetical protein [Syntrophales bacterium]HOL58429.1 hypothetical protein [Syntrophales bacterium]HPO34598.1 hypothetical protein [Syntrophales bacterium]